MGELPMTKQHYIRKGMYSINEVLSKQITPSGNRKKDRQCRVDFHGDLIVMTSDRYWTFKEKGVACVECGIKGRYFAKERDKNAKSFHFNLYGINREGKEVLMTKDHKTPKSKGGKDHVDNYDPMCVHCNLEKGNSY